ncbi:MAG TPA: hypothetical protein VFW09_20845 [Solirubrobacteraceae bacterium]|jgi:hypothetical protein|nr:hypothetical protein [Solirubrobacteraceae bacterium]
MDDRGEPDERDKALIEQLRNTLQADAVPQAVTDAAKAALGWRRLDAELAELLSDSALDAEPSLARGAALVRSVSFSAGKTIVELEVHHDRDRRTLLGQLSPAATWTVEVQLADGTAVEPVRADLLGRFRIGLERGGTIRLRLTATDGAVIETAWIPI